MCPTLYTAPYPCPEGRNGTFLAKSDKVNSARHSSHRGPSRNDRCGRRPPGDGEDEPVQGHAAVLHLASREQHEFTTGTGTASRVLAGTPRPPGGSPLLPGERPRRAAVGDRRPAARLARAADTRRARRTGPVGLGPARSRGRPRPLVDRHQLGRALSRLAGLSTTAVPADVRAEAAPTPTGGAPAESSGPHLHGRSSCPPRTCTARSSSGSASLPVSSPRRGQPQRARDRRVARPAAWEIERAGGTVHRTAFVQADQVVVDAHGEVQVLPPLPDAGGGDIGHARNR